MQGCRRRWKETEKCETEVADVWDVVCGGGILSRWEAGEPYSTMVGSDTAMRCARFPDDEIRMGRVCWWQWKKKLPTSLNWLAFPFSLKFFTFQLKVERSIPSDVHLRVWSASLICKFASLGNWARKNLYSCLFELVLMHCRLKLGNEEYSSGRFLISKDSYYSLAVSTSLADYSLSLLSARLVQTRTAFLYKYRKRSISLFLALTLLSSATSFFSLWPIFITEKLSHMCFQSQMLSSYKLTCPALPHSSFLSSPSRSLLRSTAEHYQIHLRRLHCKTNSSHLCLFLAFIFVSLNTALSISLLSSLLPAPLLSPYLHSLTHPPPSQESLALPAPAIAVCTPDENFFSRLC